MAEKQKTKIMPSKSKKQARLMAAASHSKEFAKKVGVPMKVAKEFNKADKGGKLLRAKRPKSGLLA